jgi:hypothetical protein
MIKRNLILIFIILVICIANDKVQCKKRKTNEKKKIKEKTKTKLNTKKQLTVPMADEIRPSDISRELFCDACQAIIIEALKNLRNLHKESDITFYLTNGVCLQKNFNGYHFSKPEMEVGCEVFIGVYYDEIEKLLIERNPKVDTKEKLIQNLCFDKVKACNGVKLDNIKPIESQIVNGELYDIQNVETTYQVYPKIEEVDYNEDIIKDNIKPEL